MVVEPQIFKIGEEIVKKYLYAKLQTIFELPPMIDPIPIVIPFSPIKLLASLPKLFVLPIAVP